MLPWHHGTMAPWYHGTMVPWHHGVEMRDISARMLRGRFWLENQDFEVSVGAIGIIFRDTSFPTSPKSQNRFFFFFEKLSQASKVAEIVAEKLFTLLGPNCDQGDQTCCGADFGSRIKISGHPLGQSASFFEIYPFRLWPCGPLIL